MIFSLDDTRRDGVILSNARSEEEILREADQLYSEISGPKFEEIAPKGPPENMISIDEYFSQAKTYDFVLDVRSSAEFVESHILTQLISKYSTIINAERSGFYTKGAVNKLQLRRP